MVPLLTFNTLLVVEICHKGCLEFDTGALWEGQCWIMAKLTTFFCVFGLVAVKAIMKQFHSAFDACLHPLGCGDMPQKVFVI